MVIMGILERIWGICNMPVGMVGGIAIGWLVLWLWFRKKITRLEQDNDRLKRYTDDSDVSDIDS